MADKKEREPFRKLENFDGFINSLYTPNYNSNAPFYSNRADYNTNSKSYYDDLARKANLFEILAHRIWEYDEELAKRFEEWDKNLEEFNDEVIKLLEKWIDDGTFADIINNEIFGMLNDKVDGKVSQPGYYVSGSDLGIKADGVTDDTIALQKAIDRGIPIALPEGEIVITDNIKIHPHTRLKGLGIYKTIFKPKGAITLFDGSDEKPLQDTRLEDFGVEGDNSFDQLIFNLYYWTNNSKLNNIRVEHTDNVLKLAKSWYAGAFTDLHFRNNNGVCVEIIAPVNIEQVNGIKFDDCNFMTSEQLVLIHGGAPHQIIEFNNCTLEASRKTAVYSRQTAPLIFNNCYFERNNTDALIGKGTDLLSITNPIDINFNTFSNRNMLVINNCYMSRSIGFNTSDEKISVLIGDKAQLSVTGTVLQNSESGYLDYDFYSLNKNISPNFKAISREGYAKKLFEGKLNEYIVSFKDDINLRYTNTSTISAEPLGDGQYYFKIISKDTPLDFTNSYIRFFDPITKNIISERQLEPMGVFEKKEYVIGYLTGSELIKAELINPYKPEVNTYVSFSIVRKTPFS